MVGDPSSDDKDSANREGVRLLYFWSCDTLYYLVHAPKIYSTQYSPISRLALSLFIDMLTTSILQSFPPPSKTNTIQGLTTSRAARGVDMRMPTSTGQGSASASPHPSTPSPQSPQSSPPQMSPMPPKPKLQEVSYAPLSFLSSELHNNHPYRFLAPSYTTTTFRHTTLHKTYLVPHALTPRC